MGSGSLLCGYVIEGRYRLAAFFKVGGASRPNDMAGVWFRDWGSGTAAASVAGTGTPMQRPASDPLDAKTTCGSGLASCSSFNDVAARELPWLHKTKTKKNQNEMHAQMHAWLDRTILDFKEHRLEQA